MPWGKKIHLSNTLLWKKFRIEFSYTLSSEFSQQNKYDNYFQTSKSLFNFCMLFSTNCGVASWNLQEARFTPLTPTQIKNSSLKQNIPLVNVNKNLKLRYTGPDTNHDCVIADNFFLVSHLKRAKRGLKWILSFCF